MLEFLPETEGRLVGVKASGKLTHADYETFLPLLESKIAEEGKINVLLLLEEVHGIELGALWDELKFDAKHSKDFARCAIVGDKKWEEWMIKLSKPFFPSDIKYFDISQKEAAWEWTKEGL